MQANLTGTLSSTSVTSSPSSATLPVGATRSPGQPSLSVRISSDDRLLCFSLVIFLTRPGNMPDRASVL